MKQPLALLLLCLLPGGCGPKAPDTILAAQGRAGQVSKANISLGLGYMQDRQYRKALNAFRRAREATPERAEPYHMLGLLHQQLREFARAEDYLHKALSIEPNAPEVLNNLGSLLCQRQRQDEAETVFLRAANDPLYDNQALAWSNAGACMQAAGELDKAEKYLRKALSLNPQLPVALLKLSELSYRQGEYLSARAFLQRHLAVVEAAPQSLLLGIRIEQQLGNQAQVRNFGRKLRNRFPDASETQEYRQMKK